jgi:hypothetical protein
MRNEICYPSQGLPRVKAKEFATSFWECVPLCQGIKSLQESTAEGQHQEKKKIYMSRDIYSIYDSKADGMVFFM